MKILGLEIRRATSGLADPIQQLVDIMAGGRTNAGIIVNEQSAMRMSAVWACTKVLSESIGMLPLILYRRDGDKKSRAADHPLYSILHDQPNPEMTAYTFKQSMMVHLCLRGNAYAEIERDRLGRVIALWPIAQDQFSVTPKRDDKGRIYYQVWSRKAGSEYKIPADKMLHIMGLGYNGLVGLSPIGQARQSIGLGLAAEEFGARFFGNGANLSGVLQHPEKISSEAAERLRKSWNELYSGLSNSSKTAILEEGMTYNRIGIPPEDAQFMETRKFQTIDIARIFRVPPHKIMELERATWANIEHLSIEFVTDSLGPWLENWEQTISWKLLDPKERQEYFAEYLVNALLRGDTTARYSSYAVGRQNGWLSANDIRKLENMDPIDGGDVYLVPLNMVPADQAGSRPPKPTDTQGGPSSTRSRETREEPSGPDMRRGLAESYAPVFRDVLTRIFKRERADIMRQAKKSAIDDDALARWIEEYYGEHPSFSARNILPALESYADAIGRTTEGETDREWNGLTDDVRTFIGDYADTFGMREAISSRMRVLSTVKKSADEETDRTESLNQMFDDWESSRTESDTGRETNQAANAITKTIYTLAGVTVLRWSSGSNACPICQQMHGKICSISHNFVSAGHTIDGNADTAPLTIERDLGHPPLHKGCTCQIEPG